MLTAAVTPRPSPHGAAPSRFALRRRGGRAARSPWVPRLRSRSAVPRRGGAAVPAPPAGGPATEPRRASRRDGPGARGAEPSRLGAPPARRPPAGRATTAYTRPPPYPTFGRGPEGPRREGGLSAEAKGRGVVAMGRPSLPPAHPEGASARAFPAGRPPSRPRPPRPPREGEAARGRGPDGGRPQGATDGVPPR